MVRVSRTVVRPGRRNGGTTLTFRLAKPTVVRVTIVRVFPSCERIGSFRHRAHAGLNRIRFRGRFRDRILPAGGYRLVVRARGAQRDATVIPIVVARGRTSKAAVRRARSGSMCTERISDAASVSAGGFDGGIPDAQGGGRVGRPKHRLAGTAGAVAGTRDFLEDAAGAVGAVKDKPLDDPVVLTLIGLFLVAVCLLATLLLAQVTRDVRLPR